MTATGLRTGAILAGGRSTRFEGGDKALAPLDGKPLVRHVASAVAPVVDELVVNCRVEQEAQLAAALDGVCVPVSFATDRIADRGPLFGLRMALRAAEGQYAVVAPCDTPWLSTPLLERLLSAAVGATGAAIRWGRTIQPFPSAIHVRSGLASCTEVIRSGRRELRAFLESLAPRLLTERVARAFGAPTVLRDVDARADLPVADR